MEIIFCLLNITSIDLPVSFFCWCVGLSSKGKNDSVRQHSNSSVELEAETTTCPVCACHSVEPMVIEVGYYPGRG